MNRESQMIKSALGILISLVVMCSVPVANAQQSAASAKKTTAKKSATIKSAKASKTVVKRTVTKTKTSKRTTAARKTAKKSTRVTSTRETASLNSKEKLVRKVVVVRGKRKVIYQRVARPSMPIVPPVVSAGDLAGLNMTRDPLALASNVALVLDQSSSEVLLEKNSNVTLPIASITKLMTAMVVVEAHQDMDEILEVTDDDIDRIKHSSSRLRVGSRLSRANMLHIALMSSENRAASTLGRSFPGGVRSFVTAMNAKARELGMTGTHYVDPTGLSSDNVATARDLSKLVMAALHYPVLRQYSTDTQYVVEPSGRSLHYANSNRLVANADWDIGIQKTGYISEAGHCLVMQANINNRPIVMIFLDSKGKYSRLADAQRIRKWLEKDPKNAIVAHAAHAVES
jgi:D-alanyl-D-alanine endopeptidase (penicillin-binding protein 7)